MTRNCSPQVKTKLPLSKSLLKKLPNLASEKPIISSLHPSSIPVSVVFITCTVGNLVSGALCELCGRKITLLTGNAVILTTWLTTHFAGSFTVLLLSRAVMGVGAGMSLAASYVLLGEISTLACRGALGTLNASTRNLGILFGFIVGATMGFEHHIVGEKKLNSKGTKGSCNLQHSLARKKKQSPFY